MLFYSLLSKLKNEEVTVELKNGFIFTGSFDSIDQYFNIRLKKLSSATLGSEQEIPFMDDASEIFIRGSCVLYISVDSKKISAKKDFTVETLLRETRNNWTTEIVNRE